MELCFIKVPIDYAGGVAGSARGPEYICNARLLDNLRRAGHDLSVVEAPVVPPQPDEAEVPGAHHLAQVAQTNASLAAIVEDAASHGRFPVVVGGDHSVFLGSIAGVTAHARKSAPDHEVGVIYVDAHGDFNTPETSPSGNIHGEPVAASCGLGHPTLVNLYYEGRKIDPRNVAIIGVRDLDSGERELLAAQGVTLVPPAELRRRGLRNAIAGVVADLASRCRRIHLSFDIDSVDPAYAPGTGLHVPGGLSDGEALEVLALLGGEPLVCSADFVEFNPQRDVEGRTLQLIEKLIVALLP